MFLWHFLYVCIALPQHLAALIAEEQMKVLCLDEISSNCVVEMVAYMESGGNREALQSLSRDKPFCYLYTL
jgi:hypothetical protein